MNTNGARIDSTIVVSKDILMRRVDSVYEWADAVLVSAPAGLDDWIATLRGAMTDLGSMRTRRADAAVLEAQRNALTRGSAVLSMVYVRRALAAGGR